MYSRVLVAAMKFRLAGFQPMLLVPAAVPSVRISWKSTLEPVR